MSTTKENNVFHQLTLARRMLLMAVTVVSLSYAHSVVAQQQPPTRTQWPSLGVFDRWTATRWKEYSPAGGTIEIIFERPDERSVHLRVSSGGALMGWVR